VLRVRLFPVSCPPSTHAFDADAWVLILLYVY
jgi:hypothetical protein